jgi:hypothetical protein
MPMEAGQPGCPSRSCSAAVSSPGFPLIRPPGQCQSMGQIVKIGLWNVNKKSL